MTLYHFTYKNLNTNKIFTSFVRAETVEKGIRILRESMPNGVKIKTLNVRIVKDN